MSCTSKEEGERQKRREEEERGREERDKERRRETGEEEKRSDKVELSLFPFLFISLFCDILTLLFYFFLLFPGFL